MSAQAFAKDSFYLSEMAGDEGRTSDMVILVF